MPPKYAPGARMPVAPSVRFRTQQYHSHDNCPGNDSVIEPFNPVGIVEAVRPLVEVDFRRGLLRSAATTEAATQEQDSLAENAKSLEAGTSAVTSKVVAPPRDDGV